MQIFEFDASSWDQPEFKIWVASDRFGDAERIAQASSWDAELSLVEVHETAPAGVTVLR